MQDRSCSPCKPQTGRSCNFLAVPVFQGEDEFAPDLAIPKCGPALGPWAWCGQAVVTVFGFAGMARERRATKIAAQPVDKRCVAPAFATKPEITFNHVSATDAAWGVKNLQHGLNLHMDAPILCTMNRPPTLIDRAALLRNRRRATHAPVRFLHEIAFDELKDRLGMVNKEFNAPIIVSGQGDFWHGLIPDAPLIADEDTLSLEAGAHDLVIHAMALHWANDLVGQMIQSRRALSPDGLFLGVLLGGQTLSELRASIAQAEAEVVGGLSPRIAPMAEIRDLGGLLQRAGFNLPVADSVTIRASYDSLTALIRDLRGMGETNALKDRLKRPSRRRILERAAEIYTDAYAGDDGRLIATFELIFLLGWAPDPDQPKPLRPGSAQARLAEALNAKEFPLKD